MCSLRVKTLPAVEPGAIIEYRWVEDRKSSYFLALYFQREIPVHVVKYLFKSSEQDLSLSMKLFNMEDRRYEEEPKGFRSLTMNNVPALRTEPFMPPAADSGPT